MFRHEQALLDREGRIPLSATDTRISDAGNRGAEQITKLMSTWR